MVGFQVAAGKRLKAWWVGAHDAQRGPEERLVVGTEIRERLTAAECVGRCGGEGEDSRGRG